MKAFYIIHATMILEIILAILAVLKLQDLVFMIQKLNKKIEIDSDEKAEAIRQYREKFIAFNQKFKQQLNYVHNFDLVKNLLLELSVQGLLKKFIFPKKSFFAKILSYKTAIFWFLATFMFFKNKNA